MTVDVFYPLIPGAQNSLELRFSLRSLENIEYRNVIVVGYRPPWLQNVVHIPFRDGTIMRGGSFLGWKNVVQKEFLACNYSDADDIIFMNDDVYVLRKTDIGFYIRAENLTEILKKSKERKRPMYVLKAIRNIQKLFPQGVSAYAHVPHRVNRLKYIELHSKYNLLAQQFLTCDVYVNEYRNSHQWEFQPDIKVYTDPRQIQGILSNKFFSTGDSVAKRKDFAQIMNRLFPKKSKFEKT